MMDSSQSIADAVRRALNGKIDRAREAVLTIDGNSILIRSNYEDGLQVCASSAFTPDQVADAGWHHSIGITQETAIKLLQANRAVIEKAMADAAYAVVATLVQALTSEPTYLQ